MIGLNRSILFNSIRRPKIQDLEIFVSGTVLIPFHDFTSFKIIFLPNLSHWPETATKTAKIQNCPKFKTAQDLKLYLAHNRPNLNSRPRDANPELWQIQNCLRPKTVPYSEPGTIP